MSLHNFNHTFNHPWPPIRSVSFFGESQSMEYIADPSDLHFPDRALIISLKADSSHLYDSNVKKSGSRSTGASKKKKPTNQPNKNKPQTLKLPNLQLIKSKK